MAEKTPSFVAEIDPAELAVRLMEIGIGLKRGGDSRSAREIIAHHKTIWPKEAGPYPFVTMAEAALTYFGECIAKGQRTQ